MIKEEILYQTSKTGTTVFYFVPNVTPEMVPLLEEPAYLVLNNLNVPVSFYNYASGTTEVWKLKNINGYNTNVLISQMPPISVIVSGTTGTTYVPQSNPNTINYITGYSTSQTFKKTLSTAERDAIQQRFNNSVTTTITAQTQVAVNYPTYVFFNEHEVDDMFANIKLSRTYETLDTLQIYNKPINTIPTQEALTGVLFGKLQAIQILKDEAGNNIKIPLKGVPVGIFNPTEEFPAPMSFDNNGDRFFMNLQESFNPTISGSQYFDSITYEEDSKFLKSGAEYTSVPDKFKYITITNDNGEFVIYNSPIGNQVVVFEVDLFKQGLTKDEISLNNFPFPSNDDANIGQFPCYYYNQFPIDVVPAWGLSQTGYTELNVNVNLDLRKWATYIFAPAAFGKEKLESTVARNVANTFKIQVRDMTNKKFASKVLEVTQIPNDLDRRPGSKYFWFNEMLDQRQQVEFFKFGCHVLKLPANLYDPNSYKTDNNGVPTSNKGVWLAAYQFNTFVNKPRCVRHTGGFSDGTNFWSHFNVNFFQGAGPTDTAPFAGLGKFPYEKPWSISYPEPYKIPAKPTKKRFDYGNNRTFQSPYILEEPAYEDGDLIGNIIYAPDAVAGGFGVQNANGVWFSNQIAYVATKDYMYKYEKGVSWNERYANGYEQYWSPSNVGPYGSYPLLAGMSNVVNGEKYQRLECGYGYFMKYQDWPRVFRQSWAGDAYATQPSSPSNSPAGNYGQFKALTPWSNNVYNLDDQNLAFAFDQFKNFKINQGSIDIYRIVESGLDNINIPENFVIPTYVSLRCDQTSRCADRNGNVAWKLIHEGQFMVTVQWSFAAGTVYYNDGNGGTGVYANGQPLDLYPGGYVYSFNRLTLAYVTINLPGNAGFDSLTNKNTAANYRLEAGLINHDDDSYWYFGTSFSLSTYVAGWPTAYVYSTGSGHNNGIYHNGLSDDFNYGGATYHWDQGSGQNQQEATSIGVSYSYYNTYQGGYA
jgi:hypothetical protein